MRAAERDAIGDRKVEDPHAVGVQDADGVFDHPMIGHIRRKRGCLRVEPVGLKYASAVDAAGLGKRRSLAQRHLEVAVRDEPRDHRPVRSGVGPLVAVRERA